MKTRNIRRVTLVAALDEILFNSFGKEATSNSLQFCGSLLARRARTGGGITETTEFIVVAESKVAKAIIRFVADNVDISQRGAFGRNDDKSIAVRAILHVSRIPPCYPRVVRLCPVYDNMRGRTWVVRMNNGDVDGP